MLVQRSSANALQPFNAAAASIGDAIGGLGNQAVGLFDAVHSRLLNWINNLGGALTHAIFFLIALAVIAFLATAVLSIAAAQAVHPAYYG